MLCQSSLMVGSCPFEESCLFLHDPRVNSESLCASCKTRTTPLKTSRDSFYWPDQQLEKISAAQQRYEIPESFSSSQGYSIQSPHNRGVFSLWHHFIQMLIDPDSLSTSSQNSEENCFLPQRSRLPTFVRLAQGEPDEFRLEKNAQIPTFSEWKALRLLGRRRPELRARKEGMTTMHPRGYSVRESC